MTTGTWLYPHDLHDLPELAAQLRDAELDTICVAGSYHALLGASPTEAGRTVLSLPRSAVYFRPDPSHWAGAAWRPTVSSAVDELGDALEQGRRLADTAGSSLTAWLVCLHHDDDRQCAGGATDWAVQLVTGERLPGTFCLRASEVRDYTMRLVADASARADAVQLESLHWLAQPHAVHAKVAGAAPRLSQLVLSTCFCKRCKAGAEAAGVDVERLALQLPRRWGLAWDGLAPDEYEDLPGLADYLAVRAQVVTELAAEVAASVSVPIEVVCFGDDQLHGFDVRKLYDAGVAVRALAYGDATRVREVLTSRQVSDVGLSLLPEHAPDRRTALTAVEAARAAGASSVRWYHAGLIGSRRRGWLASLTAAWRGTGGVE